jgi:hypothetical protein
MKTRKGKTRRFVYHIPLPAPHTIGNNKAESWAGFILAFSLIGRIPGILLTWSICHYQI